jgi:phosphohistidine phosphatase SixA
LVVLNGSTLILKVLCVVKTVLLMRHAEAAEAVSGQSDFDRCLTAAGISMAWQTGLLLWCGVAAAANPGIGCRSYDSDGLSGTSGCSGFGCSGCFGGAGIWAGVPVQLQAGLYGASAEAFGDAARYESAPDESCVLVVGHNPGMAMLMCCWSCSAFSVPPATLAVFQFAVDDWLAAGRSGCHGELVLLIRNGQVDSGYGTPGLVEISTDADWTSGQRDGAMVTEQSVSAGSAELQSAIALGLISGIGPRLLAELTSVFGSCAAVLQQSAEQLRQVSGVGAKIVAGLQDPGLLLRAQQILDECRAGGIRPLLSGTSEYPRRLLEICDFPRVLFQRGVLLPQDELSIAIVGSRRCTPYGLRQAERLGASLARAGLTVVSGLARGIDGACAACGFACWWQNSGGVAGGCAEYLSAGACGSG